MNQYLQILLILLLPLTGAYGQQFASADTASLPQQSLPASEILAWNAGPGLYGKAKNKIAMAVSTNPANLFWRQYMVCFDILTQSYHHEVRLAFNNNTNKLLMHTDMDPSFSFPEWRWSGYQASYGVKKEVRKYFISNKWHPYRSVQFRYTRRNWAPQRTQIYIKDEDRVEEKDVAGQTNVFDLCFMMGRQYRRKAFFFDGYYGIGVGYKTLDTEYDSEKNELKDTRFQEKRWNTVYVPIRLGMRIGVVM